jgi:PAS domain S-box-containing protein
MPSLPHASSSELPDPPANDRGLIDSVDAVSWVYDTSESRFTFVSPQCAAFGYPLWAWLEKGFWPRILHPEDRHAALVPDEESDRMARGRQIHCRIRRASGAYRWIVAVIGRPSTANGKTLLRGMLVDINDRIEAERRLAEEEVQRSRQAREAMARTLDELRETSDRASAMALEAALASSAKSSFLAAMSHEIRTPMTAILGYADLLAEEGDRLRAPVQRLDHIDTIKRNGEHLLALINDILDLSKIEAGKMSVERLRVPPARLLQDLSLLMSVRAQAKSIALDVACETAIPETIESDPLRLRQILVNIVGNAIKFTDRGGVRVRLAFERRDQAPFLRCTVEDSGIGMTPEQIAGLFQAYQQASLTTARERGGTGLGLTISRQLARLLGGDIEVTSKRGVGTRFTLRVATGPLDGIPFITPEQAAGTLHERPEVVTINGRPLADQRILLVEDGVDNRRLIEHLLTKAGATVTTAEHGKAALALIPETLSGQADDEPFDVILTDMLMPEMDGYTFARELRARGWRGRIVALTANAMQGDAERCHAAGCDGYASKPVDRVELLRHCRVEQPVREADDQRGDCERRRRAA